MANAHYQVLQVGKSWRKAREGRNPATGETIQIPAKTVVKFRLAKAAKDAIPKQVLVNIKTIVGIEVVFLEIILD